jgi:alkylation response protein AidB-like acyl-CoA dehydrogenase
MLTPIVKTYPAEMGVVSTSLAIQCMGGYGYSSEFPVEQYMRDSLYTPHPCGLNRHTGNGASLPQSHDEKRCCR